MIAIAQALQSRTAVEFPERNHLFARVPDGDRRKLERVLERVTLTAGQVLFARDAPLTHIYFPEAGMISMIVATEEGGITEVATIGCEGAAGMSASGYVDSSFTMMIVQLPGHGFRTTAAHFEDMIDSSVEFCSAVSRWRDVLLRMTLQSVACNTLHTVRQRFARWILMTGDRVGNDSLPLTQEFLAEILGVKRNAISLVAREFQKLGAIEYRRGKVTVLDQAMLKTIVCDCYSRIRSEIHKLFVDPNGSECDD